MVQHRSVRRLLAALLVAMAVPSLSLEGWGQQGHRLVGLLAAQRLTPVARQNVTWMLDEQSLADVSTWADVYRESNDQTSWWHFLNIPPDATSYDRDRDCPRQASASPGSRSDRWRDCAVDRILYHHQRLGDVTLDRADRAIALKFLVHFVGDLHQPFHALGVERGGNGILVSVFGSDQCGRPPETYPCNLHGVWDTSLIAHRQLDDQQYLALLEKAIAAQRLEDQPRREPADWAMESHAIARQALLPQQGHADEAYFTAHIATVDRRVAMAGLRLAALVNSALTTPPRTR